MLTPAIAEALNNQVALEAASSQTYLALASWAEKQAGLPGVSQFFYAQSDEERVHMLKLMRYINERGGFAQVPALAKPNTNFSTVKQAFEGFLQSEENVSAAINELVDLTLKEKDYTTHNFLQWYVTEQMEEENTARMLNDQLELVGDDKSGLYLFDRDLLQQKATTSKGKE